MNTFLFTRKTCIDENEVDAIEKNWKGNIVYYTSNIPENSFIIGRYSVLPFYKELEDELILKNSKLINSYKQHIYISDMEWYNDLKDVTPETWFDKGYLTVPDSDKGYVVKGLTNSRKFQWNECMFAKNKKSLKDVMKKLLLDSLISQQKLVIRKYIPLETFDYGENGLPLTNEWRFFFIKDKLVDYGFYWSILDEKFYKNSKTDGAVSLAYQIADRIKHKTNFFVLDIAKTQNGQWILIEINDGQMSGLSTIWPDKFYKNLKEIMKNGNSWI